MLTITLWACSWIYVIQGLLYFHGQTELQLWKVLTRFLIFPYRFSVIFNCESLLILLECRFAYWKNNLKLNLQDDREGPSSCRNIWFLGFSRDVFEWVGLLVVFYGISTLGGHLTLNPVYKHANTHSHICWNPVALPMNWALQVANR